MCQYTVSGAVGKKNGEERVSEIITETGGVWTGKAWNLCLLFLSLQVSELEIFLWVETVLGGSM